jgi:hypothetical protein
VISGSPDGTQIAHWEGIEMNYLAMFSCQPGRDPGHCRHDPKRDEMITSGNIAEGGDYVGWKVWTVAVGSQASEEQVATKVTTQALRGIRTVACGMGLL